jgi:1-acyl-sn-glycerol-3-phosphate acyltransferase
MEVHGVENVPASGACIIASNHASYLDPPAIASCVRRVVRFLGRDTLMRTPFAKWVFRELRVVPIDRTKGDIAALRRGLRVLEEGGVLGLFPEGTRTLDGNLQKAKGGIGFLISKGHAPVVPVYVVGTFDAYPKGAKRAKCSKVRLFYGKPISVAEVEAIGKGREKYGEVAELVMSRIAALRPTEPRPETQA